MKYDVVIIGGGSAGFSAASTAARAGARVCVVEQGLLGGECPNWACIPTKALLASAKRYYKATHDLQAFGIRASNVSFSFTQIMKRKDAVVSTITGSGKKLSKLANELGIDVVKGHARFVSPKTVAVGKKRVSGTSFVIATGTEAFVPPVDGLKKAGYLTFRDAVSLKKQPRSLVIIGGGPVACEFATFFSMLGTQVTLLEVAPTVLSREDGEIAALAQVQLRELGVNVHVATKALSAHKEGKRTRVTFQDGEKPRQDVLVDAVLVAAGKRTSVDRLGLAKAGVVLDDRGRLTTDVYQRTNVLSIFAAGDVDGGMQFTHTAHAEGAVAGYNAVTKNKRSLKKRDDRVVPRVTFVYPEVASVGITLAEAQAKKMKAEIARFPVGSLGRSVTENHRVGLLKVVVEKKTKKILGASMIGERAGEVIHELALAMHVGATAKDVASMIHAFPTYSESIAAALGVYDV